MGILHVLNDANVLRERNHRVTDTDPDCSKERTRDLHCLWDTLYSTLETMGL